MGYSKVLEKKTYKREEVAALINEIKSEYENSLTEQKNRIAETVAENERLKKSVNEFSKKETSVSLALINAQEKAQETEDKAKLKFMLEKEKIRIFCDKFSVYFDYLTNNYPIEQVEKIKEVFNKLKKSLDYNDGEKTVEKAIKAVNGFNKIPFNPKARIDEYISATGENGFDLDKVLNPGELELEDLCKEMGLMEE